MNKTKHTRTPWKYTVNVGPTKALIVEDDGCTIFEVRNLHHNVKFESDMRHLCHAVNQHDRRKADRDELLKALELAAKRFEICRDRMLAYRDWDASISDRFADNCQLFTQEARAAVAKVEQGIER